jgi:hypothetical protein
LVNRIVSPRIAKTAERATDAREVEKTRKRGSACSACSAVNCDVWVKGLRRNGDALVAAHATHQGVCPLAYPRALAPACHSRKRNPAEAPSGSEMLGFTSGPPPVTGKAARPGSAPPVNAPIGAFSSQSGREMRRWRIRRISYGSFPLRPNCRSWSREAGPGNVMGSATAAAQGHDPLVSHGAEEPEDLGSREA